jgi:hypothetical protein
MDQKPKIIPKKTQEMADFIKECEANPNCQGYVILQSRQRGRIMAVNLAKNTEDIDHEIIQPKQLK